MNRQPTLEPPPPGRRGRLIRLGVLIAMAGGMVMSHYLTPATPQSAVLHDIYRRILYLPVILAAFWFGLRGGVVTAVAISAAYFPHVFHDRGGGFLNTNLNRTLEVVMYLVVGLVTGRLVDRLRHEQRELRGALAELREKTGAMLEAEEHLRRADRLAALGQLTSGLAHEIRNPLGAIRGAVEILGDADIDDQKRAEFSRVLVEETQRLDDVLTNVLEFAKSQSADTPGRASLRVVLERLLVLLDRKLRRAGVLVSTELDEALPELALTEPRLQQVLLNLILNATQAMEKGGTLTLRAHADAERDSVTIEVSDTGPGIPEALREKVFEPFFTTRPVGTGLGLSIVRKLIEAHGGTIRIDETTDIGASFVLRVPLA